MRFSENNKKKSISIRLSLARFDSIKEDLLHVQLEFNKRNWQYEYFSCLIGIAKFSHDI